MSYELSTAEWVHLGVFTHSALSKLWGMSPWSAPDDYDVIDAVDYQGCCPRCCAPCHSLRALAQTGTLDKWVKAWNPDRVQDMAWWDAEKDQVSRKFLLDSWAKRDELGCHGSAVWKSI